MNGAAEHIPVLAEAALEWLAVKPDGVYVDATAGLGGHSALIAEQLTCGRLVALDRDPDAVERASERLRPFPQVSVHHANYGDLLDTLARLGMGPVDGVLIDAGVSSRQLNAAERGFSFQEDGPLDMRMDPSRGPDAGEFLARVTEPDLVNVLQRYGDVRPAKRIARAILRRRDTGALRRTEDLKSAVCEGLSFVHGTPEEVRTVFQAIRMAVNEELRWLKQGLCQAITALKPGGRIVVIAFHSGEDRVVKQVFQDASRPRRILESDGRVQTLIPPKLRVCTPKPVLPEAEETRRNPRAKSAKLRAAEKLAAGGEYGHASNY